MRACPRCGNQNLDAAASCGACGVPLEPARPAPGLKQTMLGMAPGPSVPERPPELSARPQAAGPSMAKAGTLLGMQTPFAPAPTPPPAPAAASPAQAGARGLKQTMLGYGAPQAPAMEPAPATPPLVTPPVATPTRRGPAGTLVHETPELVRNPAFGSTAPISSPPQASQPSDVPGAPAYPIPERPQYQQTMLGVARPGIAPLHPGKGGAKAHSPQEAAPRPAPARPAASSAAPHAPAAIPFAPARSLAKPKGGLPRGAIVLIIVSALLAVTAGVVAFLWQSPRPIRAEVTLDDRGSEVLSLGCDDCLDGTVVSVGANRATFKNNKAVLGLAKPLEIGRNTVVVAVHRPGIGRDEEVVLNVAVDYRVRGVLGSLSEDPPKIKVAIQTAPGAAAVVDGRPVTLDTFGKGEYAVDVSKDLEGPADNILPFEKKLPYVVTPSGGEPRKGEVTLRFGIVPLRIDAPGDGIIVDGETFMLSGRTLKDGRIAVGGRPITVDAEGRFAQLMNVSSVGETTIVVRAEAKDQAPRLVRVRVKRVANLRDEAAVFRQSAFTDYASVADKPKKGQSVALDGEVAEARLDGEVTVILLDVKKGCAHQPCLAKIVYGGRFETKRGAAVGAYGHVHGVVEGPRTGVQIPEIFAEFLLAQKSR
jgi:hypothetical protein